jgi:hypothetical protein
MCGGAVLQYLFGFRLLAMLGWPVLQHLRGIYMPVLLAWKLRGRQRDRFSLGAQLFYINAIQAMPSHS